MMPETIGSPLIWVEFTLLIFFLLAFDLGVFHRKVHAVRPREALLWSLVWMGLALFFNFGIFLWVGSEKALEFLTGYLIELALSVDNLFVFLVIFSYFAVPSHLQHRVLFWGILGAMAMRMIFIMAGAALIHTFHWIIFIFGGFLIYTGFKVLSNHSTSIDPEHNRVLRMFRKFVPTVPTYRGAHFIVRIDGRRFATLLLVVLVMIEVTDVFFAVDSIPAIFAVTHDPFIVYTSNIFAILGLRSLYFLLSGMIDKFRYLNVGLGLVLIFVGTKMVISDFYKISIGLSLGVVGTLLAGSIVASVLGQKPERTALKQITLPDQKST